MFFVAQPTYLKAPQSSIHGLNESCLLNSLQRQYAYRNQQMEKRYIQRVNMPNVELTQDLENYYVLLSKDITRENICYMNKFNNYSLKQVENSLIIRSTKDNFYKNISLPANIDMESDITYRVVNGGYKMIISIPKKISYQFKTNAFRFPEVFPDIFNNLRLISTEHVENSCKKKNDMLKRKILINNNLSDNEQSKDEKTEPANTQTEKQVRESVNNLEFSADSVTESPLENTSEGDDSEELDTNSQSHEIAPKDNDDTYGRLLKNYETLNRKTVFLLNKESTTDDDVDIDNTDDDNDSEVLIRVRKLRSPTLEEVVDEEFL